MNLQVISMSDSQVWDEIVRSFDCYDIYYLSDYVKAFSLHGDGEPQLFYFEYNNTRAMNVVMKRDISMHSFFAQRINAGQYYDFVTPYGYGGWIFEGDDTKQILIEYQNYCIMNNIICEFIRFHPLNCNQSSVASFYDVAYCGRTVCLNTESREVIWQNISSKNRNVIRKAQKANINIYWGRDEKVMEEFIPIYNRTMSLDNASQYYYFKKDFYISIRDDLKYNALWFYAKYNDITIASAIFLIGNSRMHYHLSASMEQYRNLAPSNLMIFEAANWASENGIRTLHLGGGLGAKEDGLYKFKKAFNRGDDKEFYTGKKVYNQELYEKFVSMRSTETTFDLESNFFPLYRS